MPSHWFDCNWRRMRAPLSSAAAEQSVFGYESAEDRIAEDAMVRIMPNFFRLEIDADMPTFQFSIDAIRIRRAMPGIRFFRAEIRVDGELAFRYDFEVEAANAQTELRLPAIEPGKEE